MDSFFLISEEKNYFNRTLCIAFAIVGLLGVLSLAAFYLKSSKKLDGLLKIIGIGLGVSALNFWTIAKKEDKFYIFSNFLAVRLSVSLMTFMGAEACLKLIEGKKLMFSIISKVITHCRYSTPFSAAGRRCHMKLL